MPGHAVCGDHDDDEEDDIAQIEDGKVHPVGGNRTFVNVIENLES